MCYERLDTEIATKILKDGSDVLIEVVKECSTVLASSTSKREAQSEEAGVLDVETETKEKRAKYAPVEHCLACALTTCFYLSELPGAAGTCARCVTRQTGVTERIRRFHAKIAPNGLSDRAAGLLCQAQQFSHNFDERIASDT